MSFKYTLEELQALYGRGSDEISRNTKPLNWKRMPDKWKTIMKEAIRFVKESFERDFIPLSVRQVHYHLVHADVGYKNDMKHAKALTTYLLRARVSGEIGWHMITEGESTVVHKKPVGADPEEAIKEALENAKYATGKDPWDELEKYILVFSEKRELGPQLAVVAEQYFVRLVCTRGYGMWSRMYQEATLIKEAADAGKECYVLFVTDHDPSGLDLNRFGAAILRNFWKLPVQDVRVMLTIDQVKEFDLPPAPAKVTDPRAKWYIQRFGHDAWEVDALGKQKMQEVLREAIEEFIDWEVWNKVMTENRENMRRTEELAKKYLEQREES